MSYKLIQKTEFDKVKSFNGDWQTKMKLFAYMCRYNTLVAVKKAGSGHLGSSLSAMDITTYLYLNEMNVFNVGFDSPDRDIYFSSKVTMFPDCILYYMHSELFQKKNY
ncbi:MAG TPA: hypothetical protein PK195_07115 [Ignavibacteriaceae bacterium]|nr:hypothetical protein [Ignavibacteriaceae bacterium]